MASFAWRMLDRIEIIAYELELRDTLDAALYHFEQLAGATVQALRAQDAVRNAKQLSQTLSSEQASAQRLVFDHLDAFLGAFARVSLLIFPASSSSFAQIRSATMRTCLQLSEDSPIANRDLRDSWTHHDERIDFAVQSNTGASGQVFTRSGDNPVGKLKTFLRVIELDTLIVRYRSRAGEPRSANLRELREHLVALEDRRQIAFEDLSVPYERKQPGHLLPDMDT